MSDVGMPIEGGKYKGYVDSLYKKAETRRTPMEQRLTESKDQKRIWGETSKTLNDLKSVLARLRGYDSVFGDRIVKSANEDALTATVKRHTPPVDVTVMVNQKAEADRFYSNPLDPEFNVPAGTYTYLVGEEEINFNFNGGSPKAFADGLNKIRPNTLKASIVENAGNEKSFFIESQKTGKDQKLNFKGISKNMAFDIGLITDQINRKFVVVSDDKGLKVDTEVDVKLPIKVDVNRNLHMGVISEEALEIKPKSFVAFEYKSTEATKYLKVSDYPKPLESEGTLALDGNLKTEVDMEQSNKLSQVSGEPNVFLQVSGELIPLAILSPSDEFKPITIDIGNLQGTVQGIIYKNANTEFNLEIQKLNIYVPTSVDFIPIHPASRAQDADLTLDGLKISRPTNKINDAMTGVEMTVVGKSDKPFVLSVKHDIEKASTTIGDFVWAYYINMAKVNTVSSSKENSAVVEELSFLKEEEKKQALKDLGSFQSDMYFISLKTRLHSFMSDPYVVGSDRMNKITLADIGIRTNDKSAVGGAETKRGYFDIKDENLLKSSLENRWDDVEQMFVGLKNDDGSTQTSGGLATNMTEYINTYTNGIGVIKNKTDTLDGQIKRQQKDIDDFNEKLSGMRKKWEQDFAKAAAAEEEFKRLQNQMQGANKGE